MVSDLLRHFQLTAVLQIDGDAGRTEGMIADPRLDTGRFRAPADDAVRKAIQDSLRVRTVRNTVTLATRARTALKERKNEIESAEQGSEKPNKKVHLRRGH
jgi:hypothetical protein